MRLNKIYTDSALDGATDLDLLMSACGYESRSTNIASLIGNRSKAKLAIGFSSQKELAYTLNREWFEFNQFELKEPDDSGFRDLIDEAFRRIGNENERPSFAIDVSCFNRYRMAHIVDSLRSMECAGVDVWFLYTIAVFTPPPIETAPTLVVEPVIPQFAGWTNSPDKPPAAVVGLGYEPSKAIGVIDHLEINNAVWLYAPEGPITDYLDGVAHSNASLIELIQTEGRKLTYSLADPGSLFQELNSLVDILKSSYNPLLIPFGPKLFALISLLVACVHQEVGVWRVSGGTLEQPVDRKASKFVIGLKASFEQ